MRGQVGTAAVGLRGPLDCSNREVAPMLETQESLEQVLRKLASRRPIFHSEADFQHALAWEIHEEAPGSEIRLEVPFRVDARTEYVDLLVRTPRARIAFELKYKTRRLEAELKGERYQLASHGAQDLARYDFLKDVARIERFVSEGRADFGYALMLTNDGGYWKVAKRQSTIDAHFRLCEGRDVSGTLSWGEHAAKGTTAGREKLIELRNQYRISWGTYSDTASLEASSFRYLLLRVAG